MNSRRGLATSWAFVDLEVVEAVFANLVAASHLTSLEDFHLLKVFPANRTVFRGILKLQSVSLSRQAHF